MKTINGIQKNFSPSLCVRNVTFYDIATKYVSTILRPVKIYELILSKKRFNITAKYEQDCVNIKVKRYKLLNVFIRDLNQIMINHNLEDKLQLFSSSRIMQDDKIRRQLFSLVQKSFMSLYVA